MRRIIAICVALAAVTLAAYWPVVGNAFINYDDQLYVTENPHVLNGLNWADAGWAFRTGRAGNWHPLTWLSHMLDVTVFRLHPAGHHFTSLLFHVVNGVLLFLLFNKMTGLVWRSAAVAALFALHPAHVESVAWVAERKDVLSTFFMLLSLMAYAGYARQIQAGEKSGGAWTAYALSIFFFLCGLMSKPMLVTLPFVLLLLDYWPLARIQLAPARLRFAAPRTVIWDKVPFLVLSAASCAVTFVVQRGGGAVNSLEAVPLELRVSNALISYVRYIGEMLWPARLAVIYPMPREWPVEWAIGAAVALAGITALVVWRLKPQPYLATGWFWFLGTLVPVIGLVGVGQQAMADRYSYVPLIGLFVVLAWSVAEIPLRWPAARPWLAAAAAAVLAVCGADTWRQLAYWHDSRSLFEHALAVTRDNAVAQVNIGDVLLKAGDLENAEAHFEEAVRIQPGYGQALGNLAFCKEAKGLHEQSAELLERAVRSQPAPKLEYNLGLIRANQGRLAEAEQHYRAALKLEPEFAEAWLNLGVLCAKQGRTNEADTCYATASRLNPRLKPNQADAHLTLGASLAAQHKYDQAIAEFEAAVRADPGNADAHFNLGLACQSKGDFTAATIHFAEACRLRPNDVDARDALGFALLCDNKMASAAEQFEQVLKARPEARANYYLALALDSQGKAQSALAHYREAVRLAPGTAQYLNDLAWLLATSADDTVRNGAEAVRLAEEATRLNGKEPRFWGTLDAAFAEAGRFDEAMATANKTRDLALNAGQPEVARAAERRLALYRQHKPWRWEDTSR